MSLYLALLKTSRKDIPFFMDTPFARIDSNHREKIVKEFFNKISNQIFILSTDEEIVGEYKDLIDEKISDCFTLSINDYGNTSVVPSKYFDIQVKNVERNHGIIQRNRGDFTSATFCFGKNRHRSVD